MRDHHKRSIVKTLSYRFSASIITTLIVYVLTGKLLLSLSIGFIEAISKLIWYYIHERIWNKIEWGKK